MNLSYYFYTSKVQNVITYNISYYSVFMNMKIPFNIIDVILYITTILYRCRNYIVNIVNK